MGWRFKSFWLGFDFNGIGLGKFIMEALVFIL